VPSWPIGIFGINPPLLSDPEAPILGRLARHQMQASSVYLLNPGSNRSDQLFLSLSYQLLMAPTQAKAAF